MNIAIFRQALAEPDARLLVIGYGFGDEHINAIIADAVKKTGLTLWVLDPIDPIVLRKRLCEEKKRVGRTIWNGLVGHWRGPVETLLDFRSVDSLLFRTEFWEA